MCVCARDIICEWANGGNTVRATEQQETRSSPVLTASIMLLRAYSSFSFFMWLHRAVHICSLVSVLVNYTIFFSCHSRHQLAPLSRLYIWTASNLVLCCSEHDVNLSWLDKGRKCFTLGSSLNVHLVLLNQEWIWQCASWLVIEMVFITVVGLSGKGTVWGKEIKDVCLGCTWIS